MERTSTLLKESDNSYSTIYESIYPLTKNVLGKHLFQKLIDIYNREENFTFEYILSNFDPFKSK